jgi:SAM-dependent methyltransferase
MPTLNSNYWESRYNQGETGWDIGSAGKPIFNYLNQISNKDICVLIPGCGNAHEAEILLNLGFHHVTVLDYAPSPIREMEKKYAKEIGEGRLKLVCEDFFAHQNTYDLIIEQTFFCALDIALRTKYASHMPLLLKPNGKLAGLLFNFPKTEEGPPFGGSKEEYLQLFEPSFKVKIMDLCYNSIKPREGRELFFILQKSV